MCRHRRPPAPARGSCAACGGPRAQGRVVRNEKLSSPEGLRGSLQSKSAHESSSKCCCSDAGCRSTLTSPEALVARPALIRSHLRLVCARRGARPLKSPRVQSGRSMLIRAPLLGRSLSATPGAHEFSMPGHSRFSLCFHPVLAPACLTPPCQCARRRSARTAPAAANGARRATAAAAHLPPATKPSFWDGEKWSRPRAGRTATKARLQGDAVPTPAVGFNTSWGSVAREPSDLLCGTGSVVSGKRRDRDIFRLQPLKLRIRWKPIRHDAPDPAVGFPEVLEQQGTRPEQDLVLVKHTKRIDGRSVHEVSCPAT